jgi:signal transduction histidine kinase/ActR/RegA family two-component response regulator
MYRYKLSIFDNYRRKPLAIFIGLGLSAAILLSLFYLSQLNYLLFHSIVEGYSTVIAFGIFIYGWNARKYVEKGFVIFLGIGYLFVGMLDFLHFLAYQGMGVFSADGPNLSTQLWVASRYLESLAILASFIFINRRISSYGVFVSFAIITTLILGSIFYWQIFPLCYANDIGLTDFKIFSEYAVCLGLLISLYLMHKNRKKLDPQVHDLICWSIILTILAELAFSHYIGVYGLVNMAGHLIKIVSYYLIYKAIVYTGIIRPLDLIFRELKEKDLQLKEDLSTIIALEKDRAIILSMLVHDMKTPLISIKGFSNLLLKKADLLSNDKSRDYIDVIYRQSEQLEKLVHDFLISCKSGDSKLALNLEPCNLNEILNEVAASFMERCQPAEKQIHLNLPQAPTSASIDKTRFHRAISNLLDNAIRFSPEKGIIFLDLNIFENEFVIKVQDQGPGIPDSELSKLFTPFFRGTGQQDANGYGLGLAGVKTIVESHGGSISAGNAESGGAVFTMVFPLIDEESSAIPNAQGDFKADAEFAPQRASKLILVVEDNPTNRMMAKAVLGKIGYSAHGASGGKEALEALAKEHFDLVLMDLRMPGMDGFETAKAIRGHNSQVLNRKVPIWALTANANSEERDKALQAGMNEYLTKPIDPQTMAQALDHLLLGKEVAA